MTDSALSISADRVESAGTSAVAPPSHLWIKVAVTALIGAVLLVYVDLGVVVEKVAALGRGHLAAILALLCAQLVFAGWRWHLILRALGEPVSFREDFRMYVAGAMANVLLLASVGGLSVRALLLVRRGTSLGVAALSLAVERLLVLSALIVAFVLGALVLRGELRQVDIEAMHSAALAAALILLVGGFGLVVIYRFLQRRRSGSPYPQLASLVRNPMQAVALFVSSALVLFLGFAVVAVIASALDVDVPLLLLLSVQPIIAVIASLPVSFGGWGVREGSMVVSLGILGVSA
ncbi:MAG: lysylphosphatidylglycerol synthase transmembrane domain-containing protein, partial [Methyloligellaceae bacterium]